MPRRADQLQRDLVPLVRAGSGEHDLGAVAAHALDLDLRRGLGHHDHGLGAEQPRRARHRLGVVARRVGHHSPGPLLVGQGADGVVGAAHLEGADRLEALRLEPGAVVPAQERGVERPLPGSARPPAGSRRWSPAPAHRAGRRAPRGARRRSDRRSPRRGMSPRVGCSAAHLPVGVGQRAERGRHLGQLGRHPPQQLGRIGAPLPLDRRQPARIGLHASERPAHRSRHATRPARRGPGRASSRGTRPGAPRPAPPPSAPPRRDRDR